MKAEPMKKGRAWVELDMENLRHNVEVLRRLLPERCELMPSVKANAHGHGAVEICRELNAVGVRAFCVASACEGVELRNNSIEGDILILGYTHPEDFHLLGSYNLTQTVIDLEYAELLDAYGGKAGSPDADGGKAESPDTHGGKIDVHVKIDTGMNRLGLSAGSDHDIRNILKVFDYRNLNIKGMYTHLCAQDGGDEKHRAFTQAQLNRFNDVLAAIKRHGYEIPKIHLQSSFGVFNLPGLDCDYARVGMALYGVYRDTGIGLNAGGENAGGENARGKNVGGAESDGSTKNAGGGSENQSIKNDYGLRPVLSVKARVSAVKTILPGEAVGYELAFIADREVRIAVLAIGYADGIPRALSRGAGFVLIDGRPAPFIGNICMDQCVVDVTGISGVAQGDEAVILGKSLEAEVSAYDIAGWAGTIPNEIVGRLGARPVRYQTTK